MSEPQYIEQNQQPNVLNNSFEAEQYEKNYNKWAWVLLIISLLFTALFILIIF